MKKLTLYRETLISLTIAPNAKPPSKVYSCVICKLPTRG